MGIRRRDHGAGLVAVGGYFLEYNNFIPADPLTTPEHIAPVWYFTPFYAMLRAIPSFFNMQVWGVIVMGAAVMIFFLVPWLDRGRTKSIRYRGPIYKAFFAVFIVSFLIVFSFIVFFAPEGSGYFLEFNNFIPADPLKTPPHIAPVWYFTPYYSILLGMVWNFFGLDAKFWGVVAMGAFVVVVASLPWLDRRRSSRSATAARSTRPC